MKAWIVVASIVLMSIPAAPLNGREKMPVYEDSDGYQIMSLVIMSEAESLGAKQVTIYGRTVIQPDCENIPEKFKAAAEDLKTRAKVVAKLRRKFSLKNPYDLTQTRGALAFEISSVGFDSSRTYAVVTVFRGCGALCGGGGTYLFRKINNIWQKVGRACDLVSGLRLTNRRPQLSRLRSP